MSLNLLFRNSLLAKCNGCKFRVFSLQSNIAQVNCISILLQDEQIVKNYLDFLKWEVFNKTRNNFPPARPVKLNLDSVKRSNIYQILKRFPKGGNMHLHHSTYSLCIELSILRGGSRYFHKFFFYSDFKTILLKNTEA